MDKKSLKMLEYPEVIRRLAQYASFNVSEQMAQNLHPETDSSIIRYKLSLTTEARKLLSVNDTFRLGGCSDLRPYLEVARKQGTLEAKAFVEIAYTLSIARDLYRSLSHHEAEYPNLAAIAENLIPPAGLIERINFTVNDRGEVLDSASEKLTSIRREIRLSYNRLLGRLEKMVKESRYQPMLQEPIITQRNGRYVIPLKAEYKGQLKSIIHDQSSSGATLFVEPLATVELNNIYQALQLDERNEIIRILQNLTAFVGDYADQIEQSVEALAKIDFAIMCAKYADDLRAAEPLLVDPYKKTGNPVIKLYQARHPLLPVETAVPIDVVPDEETFAVVITGPNTGGKTVSLKTIGLLILMAQSGLHIPVRSGSEISVFKNVFADIGDEQSIEQSLSTFSGHITNIIRILKEADSKTLVLLDELGSGTDPQEGSALARAILQYLIKKHIPCFVATHFSELKTFAHVTPGAINASMEFDLKTLRPTYRLSIGLPGRSNALLIAEKLGLPAEILEDARETIDPEVQDTGALLDEIHRQQEAARKARSQADRLRSLAENDERKLRKQLEEIEAEKEKILSEAHSETEAEIKELKTELAKLRKAYVAAKIPLGELKPLEEGLKESEKAAQSIENHIEKKSKLKTYHSAPLKIGEKVRVRSLGTNSFATITTIDGDEAEILLGSLRMRVPLKDLIRKSDDMGNDGENTEGSAGKSESPVKMEERKTSGEIFHPSPGVEIDLRGKTAEEMTDLLEKYLDEAVLAGLPYVRIIHGKGTGKLRQAARQFLLDSPYVKYIENGKDNEGGEGVTVAHLKV